MLVGYADDSILFCKIPHPRDKASVVPSLNDDLAMITIGAVGGGGGYAGESQQDKGMLISRSCRFEPLFPDLVIDGSVVEMVSELKILGIILDCKLTFEKQVRAIAAFASKEGWYFEKDNECFQRCRCCRQILFVIHTSCAGVLFYSLDVGCHFPPVVA